MQLNCSIHHTPNEIISDDELRVLVRTMDNGLLCAPLGSVTSLHQFATEPEKENVAEIGLAFYTVIE